MNDLPHNDNSGHYWGPYFGANAITSPSGDGVILQGSEYIYQLTCEDNNCTSLIWKELQSVQLSHELKFNVLTYLPGIRNFKYEWL